MKLLSLSSNKASFHDIKFNSRGLSLILGRQKNPEQSDARKTYNGVGKSLTIALIHFCLGANASDEFKEKLAGWEFNLEFEIDGTQYTSIRSASSQNTVILDGKELSLKKFNSEMESLVFGIENPIPYLSFRPLIKRFIRPKKESYIAFDSVESKETPYANLLAYSYLLGLDVDLVVEKHKLKNEKDRIEKFRKNLKTDSVFKEFFVGNKNPDLEIRDLEDEINRLERDIKVFQVAENYYEIEKQANDTKRKLQELKNQAIMIENSINSINNSLSIRPDISVEQIQKVYNETKAKLSETLLRELSDVERFHKELAETRVKRLSNEKIKLERSLEQKNKDISVLAKEFDSQLKFLGTYRALDELIELSNHMGGLKTRAQKIYDYKNLLEEYETQTQDINLRMINENKRASEYLKSNQTLIDSNFDRFRTLAKRFYSDKPGGLTVENNDKDNQIRFDIDARIQDDTSDGINEVKIFCFDMTILSAKHHHNVDFIFHDSRLFSNMDPRQRAILFRIANEYSMESDAQYIASVNEDQISTLKEQLAEQEIENIIRKNIVLELTDESTESKLLGMQIDIRYD
jgi:uncharacterized protein YydD (DUF2326 family)